MVDPTPEPPKKYQIAGRDVFGDLLPFMGWEQIQDEDALRCGLSLYFKWDMFTLRWGPLGVRLVARPSKAHWAKLDRKKEM